MKMPIFLFSLLILQPYVNAQHFSMAEIEGGDFVPLYGTGEEVKVEGFIMDVHPVTNAHYLQFVKENPTWRRSKVVRLFADENYLSLWKGDLELGEELLPEAPVTNVSWFAAREFCKCQEKRLPTVEEWEYVAMADKTKKTPGKARLIINTFLAGMKPRHLRQSGRENVQKCMGNLRSPWPGVGMDGKL